MERGICYRYFNNPRSSALLSIIVSFTFGLIFSPWNQGLLYFIIFLILYEGFIFYVTRYDWSQQRLFVRTGIICTSILGFIVGRYVVGFDDPLKDKKPLRTLLLKAYKRRIEVNRQLQEMEVRKTLIGNVL